MIGIEPTGLVLWNNGAVTATNFSMSYASMSSSMAYTHMVARKDLFRILWKWNGCYAL